MVLTRILLVLGLIFCWIIYSLFTQRGHFSSTSYPYISWRQFERLLRTKERLDDRVPLCPPLQPQSNRNSLKKLIGHQPKGFWTLEDIFYDEKQMGYDMGIELGGVWSPSTCSPVHRVAIIVPYRERPMQLKKFLLYIHQFLQLQMISYQIFVVEQVDELPFNRGKLFNVGFNVSTAGNKGLECLIFHDVDLLPENVFNIYTCARFPRHLSPIVNTFRYTLLYDSLFGGVTAMTRETFQEVNGFSSDFFGWGGEDDDFYDRLRSKDIRTIRLSPAISSYRMLPHKTERVSPLVKDMLEVGRHWRARDGLNTLKYTLVNHIANDLYTLIQVRL